MEREIKQSSGPFQIGTTTCSGIITMPSGTKSPSDYIKKYLIKETGQIVKHHQELSWVLMITGIELLGRCVDPDQNSIESLNNKKCFRAGLKLLGNKYAKFNESESPHDLYKFRNRLSHLTFSTAPFVISERVNRGKHLSISNGELVLVAEDFYEDFKAACERVIENNQTNSKFHIKAVRYVRIK